VEFFPHSSSQPLSSVKRETCYGVHDTYFQIFRSECSVFPRQAPRRLPATCTRGFLLGGVREGYGIKGAVSANTHPAPCRKGVPQPTGTATARLGIIQLLNWRKMVVQLFTTGFRFRNSSLISELTTSCQGLKSSN